MTAKALGLFSTYRSILPYTDTILLSATISRLTGRCSKTSNNPVRPWKLIWRSQTNCNVKGGIGVLIVRPMCTIMAMVSIVHWSVRGYGLDRLDQPLRDECMSYCGVQHNVLRTGKWRLPDRSFPGKGRGKTKNYRAKKVNGPWQESRKQQSSTKMRTKTMNADTTASIFSKVNFLVIDAYLTTLSCI